MLPDFTEQGYLPPGIHRTTLEEFMERFVRFDRSDRRFRLFDQLQVLLEELRGAEIVKRIFVVGSFVTAEAEPNDFDCLIVLDQSVEERTLRPFEYRFVSRRLARRAFKGDVIAQVEGSRTLDNYLEFFQKTRQGMRRGIVELEL